MPRKSESGLPPYTTRDKSRGVGYRPYLGKKDGKVTWGARVFLAPYDAPLSEIWARYEELHQQVQHTVNWLLESYFASRHFATLKQKTQNDYRYRARVLLSALMTNRKPFGTLPLSSVDRFMLRQYLDTCVHSVGANRQLSVLSAAWSWGRERYEIPPNPCSEVKPNKETPRTNYVEHSEFREARRLAPSWLKVAMDLSYICRARRGEVLALTYSDIDDRGLMLRRSKGSASEITLWTPSLRSAVQLSRELPATTNHLVRNERGPISKSAFDSAWRRLMVKVREHGGGTWPFHDIKAKGLSDMKEPWAGHRSKEMLDVYLRTPREVAPDYADIAELCIR